MAGTRQSAHTTSNREFWTEFFALYESLPALWDMRNPLYKERSAKADAYDIMVDKLRELEPNADREDVLRKINIFRTNYRRECTRINMSQVMGKRYKTTLWYFDMLSFLQSQESRREKKQSSDGDKCILVSGRRKRLKLFRPKREEDANPKSSAHKQRTIGSKQIIPDNGYEYEDDMVQYEKYDGDNVTESEEMLENVEYNDEKSFQQQFQNQFHTFSLQHTNSGASVQNHESFIEEAKSFQELMDDPIETNEILEEIEQEEELCGKAEVLGNTADNTIGKKQSTTKTQSLRNMSTITKDTHTATQSAAGGKISEATEILAKSWAIQYEEMSSDQRIHARKAIADILYEGCMGKLGRSDRNKRTTIVVSDARFANERQEGDEEDDDEGTEGSTYVYADGSTVKLEDLFGKIP